MIEKKLITLAATCIALVGLAGCGTARGITDPNLPMDYQVRHPITVAATSAEMEISINPQSVALLRVDETRLRAFAAAYRTRGHGALVIMVPSETPNSLAATQVLANVHTVLSEEGLHPDDVQSRPYRTSDNPAWAPLVLSFTRYEASAAPCGDWSESYTVRRYGNATPNWGCATQNNLAVMVSEPADLIGPRAMTPADATQRSEMLDRYHQGRSTTTTRNNEDDASISDVN